MRELRMALVFVCTVAVPAATAATGSLKGVVVAERDSREGKPQLLLAVPASVADQAVDEIRLELPKNFRGRLTPDRLPAGWTLDVKKRLARLRGPALAPGAALGLALGREHAGRLEDVGVRLLGRGKELLAGAGRPAALRAVATSAAVDDFIQLPRTAAPGETIDFAPPDPAATPPGGSWEIDDTPADWNGSFEEPRYQWRLPEGAAVGRALPLRVRYTDPWGETLVDGTWDKTRCGEPVETGAGPRLTGVSPRVLSNRAFCVCGSFPSGSRSRLLLNGRPLGEPLTGSSQALQFLLPDETATGPFTVAGDPEGGFPVSNTATGIHVGVRGEIDRSRLLRGETTPLRLEILGTEEPLSLRLWNRTTGIVTLGGGEDQTVTTSGGAVNQVERSVRAVSPGDFEISYALSIDSCPCGAGPGSSTAATTAAADAPLSTVARTPCEPLRKECDELRARAERLEADARAARRAADRLAEEQQAIPPDSLDEEAQRDRAHLDTLRRQAREWRELANAARASAKTNRARHEKWPGYNWDYWADADDREAARRDAEAERLEREARDLEARAKEKSDRAQQHRDALNAAKAAADAAEAAAAAARAAYEACLARLASVCPRPGSTTSTTSGGDEDDGDDPRDAPPPTVYGEELDDEKTCPQRDGQHPGCIALIVDIAKHDDWRPGSLTDTQEHLEAMQCDVDYVAPAFRSVPPRSYWVEREIWSWSEMRFKTVRYVVNTSSQREAALYVNRGQKGLITQATERFRGKLRKGAVFAFQMIYAHGSQKGVGHCGRFGPSADWWNNSIDRVEFYQGNYQAAKGNVCSWYAGEMSCYSHAAVRLFDNLNNTGAPSCQAESTQNLAFHAGYESNIAQSCSKIGRIEVCSNYDIAYLTDDIDDTIEDETARRSGAGYGPKTAFTSLRDELRDAANSSLFNYSTYADQGYEMCVPESHTHRGPY